MENNWIRCRYQYNKRCKWELGAASEIRVGSKRTMVKIYRFVKGAKVWLGFEIGWAAKDDWFFFSWIPIDRVHFLGEISINQLK